ncbi:alpha/beta fold hydrolase [Frankia sp. QA3]|uniref:alpha/beta fold hydrolase n=1 Tax=Frankia sp. QA3 TaxID=710111 RepID=UPI000269C56C|nr:alpha/beta hydrolase [Frankia sp. QA3]EIV93942.1 putative hydrolase or acyltransferase of alpha/beta superfamily [Frankia sp. QA3]
MPTTVRTEVLDISVEVTGPADGPPVVLLHGWPDAARGWHGVQARLNEQGWRTIVADLRGSGATRFRHTDTPRDGQAVALAADALDLADALGLGRIAVVGHDWGARVAYTLAALAPQRLTAIAALALAYQPRGSFTMPGFEQARAFWYQWLMFVDAGARAVREDPVGFARLQWDTWSPPGWFDDDEFAATAPAFTNPDWAAITLNAYRARFRADEPRDPRYDDLRRRLAEVERIAVPTLMIQGGDDRCDSPAASAGQAGYFTGGYRRVVLDGVGHFPHREATAAVADLVGDHLRAADGRARAPGPG